MQAEHPLEPIVYSLLLSGCRPSSVDLSEHSCHCIDARLQAQVATNLVGPKDLVLHLVSEE
jgi:hypothetical protein